MDTFTGFQSEDFDVFAIDGLDARMEAIKTKIRPKFTLLGEQVTPFLSVATGTDMHYHIAKHARRTVNPPKDTWIAWADDKRGYKKHPHFQIGLWHTHLFIWYAVIYEAPSRQEIAHSMNKQLAKILDIVPDYFHWSPDHMQPHSTSQQELGKEGVKQMIHRLETVNKAELLCGLTIDRHDPVLSDGTQLMKRLEETLSVLTEVYNLNRNAVQL